MTNSVPSNDVPQSTPSPSPKAESQQHKSVLLGDAGDTIRDGDNIYLDLDTILDTRMGTLSQMGAEYAVDALNSGRYHKRMIDEFDGVNKQVFREAYAKRDIDTLKQSILTNMVFFLRRMIKDSILVAVMHQKVEKMCFTVNVWPYDFSDPGLVEMLIGCMRFHTYSTASVQIVSIPPEELTPDYCRDHYQIMIKYNWVDWVAEHKQHFQERGVPQLTVVAPEIFYDKVPTQEEIIQYDLQARSPFRQTEMLAARLFRLKLMPISLFSIHESITKENAAEISRRVAVTQEDIESYLNTHHPEAEHVQDNPLPEVDLSKAMLGLEDLL